MDPLSAIGLVSSVITFVDFGYEVISAARELRASASGRTADNNHIEFLNKRMAAVASDLSVAKSSRGVSADMQRLSELADKCLGLSDELQRLLNKLRADDPKSKRQVFSTIMKNVWKKDQKKELEARLDQCRQQLHLQLSHTTRLESLSRLDEIAQTGSCHDKELRGLNHQLGILKDVVGGLNPSSKLQDEARTVLELSDLAVSKVLQNSILEALRFERMDSRFDSIEEAHAETFKWLLKEDTSDSLTVPTGSTDDPWFTGIADQVERDIPLRLKIRKSFTTWLSRGNGIFHISGKPGAGKSTLLKYLAGSEETKKYLDVWPGGRGKKLIFASFFFWKHGNEQQRSFHGLLRSLLFSVLEQQPDLARIVFPTQWQTLDRIPGGKSHLRWSEIQNAFRILTQTPEIYVKHKFAFFVDGLDEFEGHDDTLIKTLFEWAHSRSENVKICVSSRELPIFQQRFSECLKFRLHEVTYHDIFLFVYDTLRENEDVKSRSQPREVADLGRLLVNRAEGVFLWVSLAVRMLEQGLLQEESFQDLKGSIDVLPSKLDQLFRVIFDSLMKEPDPVKRRRAMRFLSLAVDESEISKCRDNLFLTHLSFIDDYDRDPDFGSHMSANDRIKAPDKDIRLSRCRKQVNGCCRGLLSVSHRTSSYSHSDIYAVRKDTVALTHRSLIEFFKLPDILVHIENQSQGFDRLHLYCQSLLAEVKVWRLCPDNTLETLTPRVSSHKQDSTTEPTQSELLYGDAWLVHDLQRLVKVYYKLKRDPDITDLLSSILQLRQLVEAEEGSTWNVSGLAWYINSWSRSPSGGRTSLSSPVIRLRPRATCTLMPLRKGLYEFWPSPSAPLDDKLRVVVLTSVSRGLTNFTSNMPCGRYLRCLALCLADGTCANSLLLSDESQFTLTVWQNIVWGSIVDNHPPASIAPTWMLFLLHGADRNFTLTLERTCNISTGDKLTKKVLITGHWGPEKYQTHSPILIDDTEDEDGFLALIKRQNWSVSLEEITYFWFAPYSSLFRKLFELYRNTSDISTEILKVLRQELGFDPERWHDQSWDYLGPLFKDKNWEFETAILEGSNSGSSAQCEEQ